MKVVFLVFFIIIEIIPLDGLTRNEHLQFLQLQNAAYNMYIRTFAERKQKLNVFKSWYAATTVSFLFQQVSSEYKFGIFSNFHR